MGAYGDSDRELMWRGKEESTRSALVRRFFVFVFVSLFGWRPERIAPGIRLRPGHDTRNIWILTRSAALNAPSPRTRFGSSSRLLLLLLGTSTFALALATGHWVAGCHRQSFYRKRPTRSEALKETLRVTGR